MTPHQLARFALSEATETRSGPMKPKGPLRLPSGFRLMEPMCDDNDPSWDQDDVAQTGALMELAEIDMPWEYLEPMDAYDAETR